MKTHNPSIAIIEKEPFVARTLEMFLKGAPVENFVIFKIESEFFSVFEKKGLI